MQLAKDIINRAIKAMLVTALLASVFISAGFSGEKSSEMVKIYLLTKNAARSDMGEQFIAKLKSGQASGVDFIDFVNISRRDEANTRDVKFLLEVEVVKTEGQKTYGGYRFDRDNRPDDYVSTEVSYDLFEVKCLIYKAVGKEWERLSEHRLLYCTNKYNNNVTPSERITAVVLDSMLDLHCEERGGGENTEITGRITNKLPFGLKNIRITARVNPPIGSYPEAFTVVNEIRPGERKDFRFKVPQKLDFNHKAIERYPVIEWNHAFIIKAESIEGNR